MCPPSLKTTRNVPQRVAPELVMLTLDGTDDVRVYDSYQRGDKTEQRKQRRRVGSRPLRGLSECHLKCKRSLFSASSGIARPKYIQP